MRRLIYFVLGFIIWVLLTWPFTPEGLDVQVIIAGVIAAALVALLFHELLPAEHHVFVTPARVFWAIVYVPVFFYYVIAANLDVVYRVLHPRMPIKPGIVKVNSNLKSDSAITALANSITLTPGTLSVDVGPDNCLYVHWIYVKSPETEQATQFIARRFEWFLSRIFE